MVTACANADAMFYSCKSQFRETNPVLQVEKCPFLVLARNTIMWQFLIVPFSLHYLSSGGSRLKTKESFKLLFLNEVAVAYERWSLTRGSE